MGLVNAIRFLTLLALLPFVLPVGVRAADSPRWGQRDTCNMISAETGLPAACDPVTSHNLKWVAPLGTESYATPVVAGGKVMIGANNERPRDPAHTGDRGVLYCFNERDGSLCWQLITPKFSKDPYSDWPRVGLCSTPTVEGDRVYVVTNRNEVLCLDLNGLANGNDGPFMDEAQRLTPAGAPAETLTARDADITWCFDMASRIGTMPHDSPNAAILIDGDFLYVNTSSGVGTTHKGFRNVEGPNLIVLDKRSGRLLARDDERIGARIFHCNWSSPSLGEAGGRKMIFYGASDGLLRAFEPLAAAPAEGTVCLLKRLWLLDCDPNAPRPADSHEYMGNRQDGPSVLRGMPVFDRGRLYLTVGGDVWWGKMKSWLKCIDAARGAELWSCPLEKYSMATPSVVDGLVYATDCAGNVHCVDAATGRPCWKYKLPGEIWSSTLVADGKVYAASRGRELCILAAGRQLKVLGTARLDAAANATPVAANGTLYVATMKTLYAFTAAARR